MQKETTKTFEPPAGKPIRHSRLALGVFLALLFVTPITSYWVYSRQTDKDEQLAKESLSLVANARAVAISASIHERLGDGLIFGSDGYIGEAIRSFDRTGYINAAMRSQIRMRLNTLKNTYDYLECAVLDTRGNFLVSTEDTTQRIDTKAKQIAKRVVDSNETYISSIRYTNIAGKLPPAIDIGAPIVPFGKALDDKPTAVLLLRFDPKRQVYPFLQIATPLIKLQMDILLAEIQDQQVILLSDGSNGHRFLDVLPISPEQLRNSAKRATNSLVFQNSANDTFIAAVHRVSNMPWFVIAVAPENAVYTNIRETAWATAISTAVMLCIFGIGIWLWWKYKESELQLATLQTEAEKRFLQKQYDYLSKYGNDMIILADSDYRILQANDKTLQVLGYKVTALTGQPLTVLSPPTDYDRLRENLNRLRREGTAVFEIFHQRQDGTTLPVDISAWTIDFGGKSFNQFICRDISERKEAERKIQSLAYYDAVTTLPNRALLSDRLGQAVHMASRSKKKVAILFMDLDNFKNINDSLGHQIGDMLLYVVGQRLLGCVREEDTVARIGGDEFLILLSELDKGGRAHHVADKIIAEIAKPVFLEAQQIYTTTSIGISLFPDDSQNVSDLIKYADSALYEAKSRGRNNYQFFTQALNDQITRASEIERQLRQAMDNGTLCLWYQPQIDARDGSVIGAEALLRWQNGIFDQFTPTDLIAIAEERGLIAKLGEWTIREACAQCRLWQLKGLRSVPVSVNVSPIQLQQKQFAELVLRILRESSLDASYLELEITETSIMQGAQMVGDLALRLRDSGVRISIDDFGTGYSSLSFLKHIPIDKIKIDQSFIVDMINDADDETITQTIVNLGRNLQLRVVAEGVESQGQMEKLLSFGCYEAQGYFYSEAVSSDAFQTFLVKDWCFMRRGQSMPQ